MGNRIEISDRSIRLAFPRQEEADVAKYLNW